MEKLILFNICISAMIIAVNISLYNLAVIESSSSSPLLLLPEELCLHFWGLCLHDVNIPDSEERS
ncbi:MAG: hypothetical protein FMNOHCHN_03508 [Ignavibacteriaceae bacterium]|nr:hypothetical protein [Ignavibacteriaceae bacterium]